MAELLRAEHNTEVRAVSAAELMHKIRDEDRERIVASLNSRTTAEIERERTLQQAAAVRLSGTRDRRTGGDRRSGRDRRSTGGRLDRLDALLPRDDRRSGRDRRSGSDRRSLRRAYIGPAVR